MTIHLAYQRLLAQLYDVYDNREAANIADMVIEFVTGQRRIDRITYKDLPINAEQQLQLNKITGELIAFRPVQYALGEAWFMNMKLIVNTSVLIPRPETEELVQWITDDLKKAETSDLAFLDIGTGSGCISIAIKKIFPKVTVSAIDISPEALQVATLNSISQNVLADFLHVNFLHEEEWNQLGKYNIIVSNPPYIRQSEKKLMHENVTGFEPHVALFVPDEDPLLFYKAIAKFSLSHLKNGGSVYIEINEALGKEVSAVFRQNHFKNIVVRKDMQGKDRMVKASLNF